VKRFARQFGVDVAEIKIVDNRFRWGSCTLKDNININWRLIKAPMFVIDYVVVHELAHLIEGNHTPRFWNLIKSQISNVEKAKDWLKDNGQLLEQSL
jgi:predicted metal-dependent hydrolase